MGKWSRRALLTSGVLGGGALLVGVGLRPGHRAPKLSPLVANSDETLINAWVKIGSDNIVTAVVPHAEMGQGIHSTLAQMLADEMDADWRYVQTLEAPAHEEYANYALGKGFILGDSRVPAILSDTVDGAFLSLMQTINMQLTGGSASVRTTGLHAMRVAGAAARQMLMGAAAEAWKVSTNELHTEDSHVMHSATGRSEPYSKFVTAAASNKPPSNPKLKKASQYRLMGTSVRRGDIEPKTNGLAKFGIDAVVPGMKYAAVMRSPVFGGRLMSVNKAAAEAAPGVVRVVELDNAVAVVADGYWQASQALKQLDVSWDNLGNGDSSSQSIFSQFAKDLDEASTGNNANDDVVVGDVDAALGEADRVIESEYRVPYLAHATMEPLNCTVWIHDGLCEVWTGSQNPLGARADIAEAIGFEPNNVEIHNGFLGGGFGRRAYSDYAVQAAKVSLIAGVPVKLIWSREEDVRQDRYRPAATSRFRAGLDSKGHPVGWINLYVDKHDPAEAPHIPYAIDNQRIQYVLSPTHVPFGFWRSVDHSQHGFFTESFVDELAWAAGKDPFEFRRELLSNQPRLKAVLELAAEKSDWDNNMLGSNRGRGIALQHSFGSIVAQVIDVTVESGIVSVDRIVCAVDTGFAINPDGVRAQMESGIVYGLTAALYGEISISNGAVSQSNFHDYELVRIDQVPDIETHVINGGGPIGGAGEPGTPAVAPALANAIFSATGTRIRQLPIKNYDLTFRIEERAFKRKAPLPLG